MSNLYIVATPIGNLDDLTIRAVRILREVPMVIAEDTRVTRKILDHIQTNPRIVSFHRRSLGTDVDRIVGYLSQGDAALVSDAGTPGVNDPGQKIVSAAVAQGHCVVPVPGPSSVMAALSISGFYVDQFASYGFLPSAGGKRRRLLREIAQQPIAAVFFETPHRLTAALQDIADVLKDRQLTICREMTKLHEEVWRGTAADALEHFDNPRGEFVIVVAPLERGERGPRSPSDINAKKQILTAASELADRYDSRRDLVDAVAAKTQLPKNQVYQTIHRDS